MQSHDFDTRHPWHSPERAWIPLIWVIRIVALALAVMVFAPALRQVVLVA